MRGLKTKPCTSQSVLETECFLRQVANDTREQNHAFATDSKSVSENKCFLQRIVNQCQKTNAFATDSKSVRQIANQRQKANAFAKDSKSVPVNKRFCNRYQISAR